MIAKSECEAVANCEPGAVERVLKLTKVKIAKATDKDAGSVALTFFQELILHGHQQ